MKPQNPSMDVYTIITNPGKPDYWFKIGRAWQHSNGDGGFNIVLNALPAGTNKLVVKGTLPVKKTPYTRNGTWVDNKEYDYEDPDGTDYDNRDDDYDDIPF